jgi:SAM-dependent methyltransferase
VTGTEGHDELFDLGKSYDAMLQQGLDLSGETKDYFIDGRIAHLRTRITGGRPVTSILDFACGVGDSASRLRDAFGAQEVVGVDVASGAIDEAQRRVDDERVRFALFTELDGNARFDLCYVNGAYHHIPVEQRLDVTRRIFELLRPGGVVALFENNPWSVPARAVMRRIPFDRDAAMLRPASTRRLLRAAGFTPAAPTTYLFFFPRALRPFRGLEPSLRRLPLGAQYLVVGRRPDH